MTKRSALICGLGTMAARVRRPAQDTLKSGACAFFAPGVRQYNITSKTSGVRVAQSLAVLLWALMLVLPATAHSLHHPAHLHHARAAITAPLCGTGENSIAQPQALASLLAAHQTPDKDDKPSGSGAHDCSFCAAQNLVGAVPAEPATPLRSQRAPTARNVAVWHNSGPLRFHQPPSRAPPHLG